MSNNLPLKLYGVIENFLSILKRKKPKRNFPHSIMTNYTIFVPKPQIPDLQIFSKIAFDRIECFLTDRNLTKKKSLKFRKKINASVAFNISHKPLQGKTNNLEKEKSHTTSDRFSFKKLDIDEIFCYKFPNIFEKNKMPARRKRLLSNKDQKITSEKIKILDFIYQKNDKLDDLIGDKIENENEYLTGRHKPSYKKNNFILRKISLDELFEKSLNNISIEKNNIPKRKESYKKETSGLMQYKKSNNPYIEKNQGDQRASSYKKNDNENLKIFQKKENENNKNFNKNFIIIEQDIDDFFKIGPNTIEIKPKAPQKNTSQKISDNYKKINVTKKSGMVKVNKYDLANDFSVIEEFNVFNIWDEIMAERNSRKKWYVKSNNQIAYGPFANEEIYNFLKTTFTVNPGSEMLKNSIIIDSSMDIYFKPDAALEVLESEMKYYDLPVNPKDRLPQILITIDNKEEKIHDKHNKEEKEKIDNEFDNKNSAEKGKSPDEELHNVIYKNQNDKRKESEMEDKKLCDSKKNDILFKMPLTTKISNDSNFSFGNIQNHQKSKILNIKTTNQPNIFMKSKDSIEKLQKESTINNNRNLSAVNFSSNKFDEFSNLNYVNNPQKYLFKNETNLQNKKNEDLNLKFKKMSLEEMFKAENILKTNFPEVVKNMQNANQPIEDNTIKSLYDLGVAYKIEYKKENEINNDFNETLDNQIKHFLGIKVDGKIPRLIRKSSGKASSNKFDIPYDNGSYNRKNSHATTRSSNSSFNASKEMSEKTICKKNSDTIFTSRKEDSSNVSNHPSPIVVNRSIENDLPKPVKNIKIEVNELFGSDIISGKTGECKKNYEAQTNFKELENKDNENIKVTNISVENFFC